MNVSDRGHCNSENNNPTANAASIHSAYKELFLYRKYLYRGQLRQNIHIHVYEILMRHY